MGYAILLLIISIVFGIITAKLTAYINDCKGRSDSKSAFWVGFILGAIGLGIFPVISALALPNLNKEREQVVNMFKAGYWECYLCNVLNAPEDDYCCNCGRPKSTCSRQ